MSSLVKILNLANFQHGAFSTKQVCEMGISRTALKRLEAKSIVRRVCRGAYVLDGTPESWSQKAMVAVLSCSPSGLLSHSSVLVLLGLMNETDLTFGLRHREKSVGEIHVVTWRSNYFMKDIQFHRSVKLLNCDFSNVTNSIPHVSLERALIESFAILPRKSIDFIVDRSIARRLTSARKVLNYLDELSPSPGRPTSEIRKLVESYLEKSAANGTESILEKRVGRIIESFTGTRFISQYQVKIGHRNYRLDFADPKRKIAIEVDGFEFHHSRMQFDDDRIRQNDLISDSWRIARVTSAFSDDQILAIIRGLFNTPSPSSSVCTISYTICIQNRANAVCGSVSKV